MNTADQRLAEGILFTDQYQLTMAQLYYRMGLHERRARFEHFFRSYPDYGSHKAGYCINAGLQWLIDWIQTTRFGDSELAFLKAQTGQAGTRLFDDDFLRWLKNEGTFDGISLQAIPEGRVVHPNVPLTAVEGPLAMTQILETSLLNHLNYQTLIATKAVRMKASARGRLVVEFGLRRAQERGANAGARAALIGGADSTSNVGISHVLGYQPKGTHAHSMVQAYMALGGGELDAFRAYADVYPDDCLLLVDTIDTLRSGIPNAIRVFHELRERGHRPLGVRLDSGDLAYLSIQAARMLNDAGFPDTTIFLSNQLDELVIWQIITQIEQEAPRYGVDPDHLVGRLAYGIGTRLITSGGQAALDGVYKLVAVEGRDGWQPTTKISETPVKTLNPGRKRVWRLYDARGKATADCLSTYDERLAGEAEVELHHPTDDAKHRKMCSDEISEMEELLVDVIDDGRLVYESPSIEHMRTVRLRDTDRLDPGVKRLINPHVYHVSLTRRLWQRKHDLVESAKAGA